MKFICKIERYQITTDSLVEEAIKFDSIDELKSYLDSLTEEKYIFNKYTIFSRNQ